MKTLTSILNENKKVLSSSKVTTLSYDLETKDDSNINQEIKDYLIGHGWNFSIPQMRVIKYNNGERTEKCVETPMTTAWKASIPPANACEEFRMAIESYNAKHVHDRPARLARGSAFATRDNEYDAVRIE